MDNGLAEYENTYGLLEYMELDILPPVFIRYFYVDDVPTQDTNDITPGLSADTSADRAAGGQREYSFKRE